MSKQIWVCWCEFDMGQEYVVFSTKLKAEAWAEQAVVDSDVDDTYQELRDAGLIGFKSLTIDPE